MVIAKQEAWLSDVMFVFVLAVHAKQKFLQNYTF